jgi:glycosyltransferase involved in cell wall biosynthesis
VTVLYAGRVDAERRAGFRELVRALAALSRHLRVRAVVLSDRPPRVPPALLTGPRASLDFPGWLVDPSRVFRTADVIVGCGRVIREGMASGKPCLLLGRSYRGLVFPVALDPGRGHDFSAGGRERPPSAERIAADLLRLVKDPDLAARLGTQGRAYALAHLGLAEAAARTAALYEKVRR